MGSVRADLGGKIHPEPMDRFERLPDCVILLIFNRIGDVKALGRCCVVSRRFHSLAAQVDEVVVRVDCVISNDDPSAVSSSSSAASAKYRHTFALFWTLFAGVIKPLLSITQLITPSSARRLPSLAAHFNGDAEQNGFAHHSPTQVLKNFREIKLLRIELPTGELGVDDGILLKWKAGFGSTLDDCVILGASSVVQSSNSWGPCNVSNIDDNNQLENDNESIPESFYTNGGLKLRVVWTISSLIAASARHYLLQPLVSEHTTLEKLILTDTDGQGELSMNKEQLEEMRVKPLSASLASKRTLVPSLNMRLWYAQHLELPNGTVLKGATLVAIKPSEHPKKDVADAEANWAISAFEEPFRTAAKMLVKRRTYSLEMNSF